MAPVAPPSRRLSGGRLARPRAQDALATAGGTPALRPDACTQLGGGNPRHANHFLAAAQSGRNVNGRSRHLQKFCEKLYTSLIRPPFDGRSSQRNFQRIAQFPGNRIFLSAGMDFDGKRNSILRRSNSNHELFHHGLGKSSAPLCPSVPPVVRLSAGAPQKLLSRSADRSNLRRSPRGNRATYPSRAPPARLTVVCAH